MTETDVTSSTLSLSFVSHLVMLVLVTTSHGTEHSIPCDFVADTATLLCDNV